MAIKILPSSIRDPVTGSDRSPCPTRPTAQNTHLTSLTWPKMAPLPGTLTPAQKAQATKREKKQKTNARIAKTIQIKTAKKEFMQSAQQSSPPKSVVDDP